MSPVAATVRRRYLLRGHISFLLFFMLLLTAVSSSAEAGTLPDPSAPIPHSAAPVTVLSRTVLIFRVPVQGVTPVERAERAEETLRKLLDKGGTGVASFHAMRLSWTSSTNRGPDHVAALYHWSRNPQAGAEGEVVSFTGRYRYFI